MQYRYTWFLAAVVLYVVCPVFADSNETTRIASDDHHACTFSGGYPYRSKSEYVLQELDLKPGDVVADIGAGDGWWTIQMAEKVGAEGVIHATEVEDKKLEILKKKVADWPQVKAALSPTDSSGLSENSCDLAFLSKVYHHLNEDGHVDYLRHLRSVVKPAGRLCIIERYPEISTNERQKTHGWTLSKLVQQAEEAGWIPVRCELIRGTYHYIAIFAPREIFPPEPSRRQSEEKKKS